MYEGGRKEDIIKLCKEQIKDMFPDVYIDDTTSQRELLASLLSPFVPDKGYRTTWCDLMYTVMSWFDEGTFPSHLQRDDYDNLVDPVTGRVYDSPLYLLYLVPTDKLLTTLQTFIERETKSIKRRILENYNIQLLIFDYDEFWQYDDDRIIQLLTESSNGSMKIVKSMFPELKCIKQYCVSDAYT